MADLLLELFSEEIPARMQTRAAADLERLVNQQLLDAGFMPEGVKGFATPRRLALVVTGLPNAQPDRREERKGPRVGAPEKAVEGFLKSAGLTSLDQCETREDKKGEYYVARIEEKGRPTAEVIAGFMPEVIAKFPWPKSMRWGDGELRWVRPLHAILCAFDGEIVEFEVDGVKASDRTWGHRFMAPEEIQVRNFEDYAAQLKRAKVVLDTEERKETILGEAEQLCKAQGLELVEDEGLLNEVAGLAEWPVVMVGSFDEKFLTVPDEALTASMRGHQKYFSVRDPKTGRLANKFVYVANIEAPDGGAAMRTGYERVLTARLSDAWFLYQQDLKSKLADHAEKLEKVTFFEGLGTVADKVERIAALARDLAPAVDADPDMAEKAARLAKADLVTQMVYEFPELQGLMGAYYAEAEGQSAEIVNAIRDHYKPAGQNDDVPTEPVTVAVALADKLDTLTAFWAIGKKPTGSGDPFALRRAALGIIELINYGSIRANLDKLCDYHFDRVWVGYFLSHSKLKSYKVADGQNVQVGYQQDSLYSVQDHWMLGELRDQFRSLVRRFSSGNDLVGVRKEDGSVEITLTKEVSGSTESDEGANPKVREYKVITTDTTFSFIRPADLLAFFHDRLKVYLRDKGHAHDHVDAVRFRADGSLEDDIVLIVAKLEALDAFLKTDDGANLTAAYKRTANILKAEEKKGDTDVSGEIDDSKLVEPAEKQLFMVLNEVRDNANSACAEENFEKAMSELAKLRVPLDTFFEDVTVNSDDAALRNNRLALLSEIKTICEQVADLSRLEG